MTKKKIYAINGSPRKGYNTDQLLQSYLKGAESISPNIETEMIYLYDYNYTGCRECMVCKLKNGSSYGRCGYPDDIHQLLQDVSLSDAIVFGTPVFFYEMSAELRAFIERLMYPYTQFKKNAPRVIAPKKIPIDFIYTMNVTEDEMESSGYKQIFSVTENWLSGIFGHSPNQLYSCYTYQYKDYEKYEADFWNIAWKKKVHEEQFPKDMEKAYQMGQQTAHKILG